MNLAKTIQLDLSDTHVFDHAAEPGEWAISGTFAFVDGDPAEWSRKRQLAFQTAWLGIASFGHSTFVQVTEISGDDHERAIQALANYLIDAYNAPSLEIAIPAARQEIEEMAALCAHPPGTLLAIERAITGENITEKARVMAPADKPGPAKIWTVLEHDKSNSE